MEGRRRVCRSERGQAGFTLLEITLVILIIGVMLTMVVPRVLDFLNTIKTEQPWPTQLLPTDQCRWSLPL